MTNCVFGDVQITYDQMHGRFIMTLQVLDRTSLTSYLMISVSNGATYASGWVNWALSQRNDGQTTTNNWTPTGGNRQRRNLTSPPISSVSSLSHFNMPRCASSKSDSHNLVTVTLARSGHLQSEECRHDYSLHAAGSSSTRPYATCHHFQPVLHDQCVRFSQCHLPDVVADQQSHKRHSHRDSNRLE